LDDEAIEVIKGIDIDSMEQYLDNCLESIEKTELHLREQEEVHKISDPVALERSQAYMEGYIKFLSSQKSVLQDFKIHDKIDCEADFDKFEDEVRAKLEANGDKLDQWFTMLENGREELDRLSVEHQVLLEEAGSLKVRDPARFDQEVEAEVRAKRPDLFNKVYPPIIEEECEQEEKEVSEGTTTLEEKSLEDPTMALSIQ
jgi:hypothetical protein